MKKILVITTFSILTSIFILFGLNISEAAAADNEQQKFTASVFVEKVGEPDLWRAANSETKKEVSNRIEMEAQKLKAFRGEAVYSVNGQLFRSDHNAYRGIDK